MTRVLLMISGFLLLLLMISGILLLHDVRFSEAFAARVRTIHGEVDAEKPANQAEAVRGWFTRLASIVGILLLRSGMIPAATKSELEVMLSSSGLRGAHGLHVFLGCKIFAMLFMVMVGLFLTTNLEKLNGLNLIVLPMMGVIGLVAPDWIVGKRRTRYLERVEKGLPDALDLMVICTQAGLGLGASVVKVADELRFSYRELALEFAQTSNELQIMSDPREALVNLGTRTGIEGFKRFSLTLIQTMQYGTPISDALRALSAELREEMLQKFEEKAARLPVIITLPMIVFILPCVFIIAAGPAMLQVSKIFGK